MKPVGYIQVSAYASIARIPLENVAVAITDPAGSPLALRLTDRSGLMDEPVAVPVPERSAGEAPDTGVVPFAAVDLYARLQDYQEIFVRNLQVFPDTVTLQDLPMIPLSELPDSFTRSERFDTDPQNL